MKKVLIFIAGVVIGAILMLVHCCTLLEIRQMENLQIMERQFREKKGIALSENNFEVFQVLDSGDAFS